MGGTLEDKVVAEPFCGWHAENPHIMVHSPNLYVELTVMIIKKKTNSK